MIKRLPYLLFTAVLLSGCSDQRTEMESLSEPAYSKQYRAHSMTAIVTLSETNIPTSGKIQLMIDVQAPADIEVTLPEIGTAIDPFAVADGYTEPAQTLPNGKQLTRRVWILTPGLAGTTEFQSLEIHTGSETVKTAPIRVTVESLLPPGTDTFEIKDIAAPVVLLPQQEKKRRSIYTLLSALLILILIPFGIILVRRPKPVVVVLPHETAFQALEKLPEDSVERVHELNRIFRAYFEARFNVPMIGKTTIEILPVVEDIEINEFLGNCDNIRFANKVPKGFTEQAEQFVRGYVEKTMEVPE